MLIINHEFFHFHNSVIANSSSCNWIVEYYTSWRILPMVIFWLSWNQSKNFSSSHSNDGPKCTLDVDCYFCRFSPFVHWWINCQVSLPKKKSKETLEQILIIFYQRAAVQGQFQVNWEASPCVLDKQVELANISSEAKLIKRCQLDRSKNWTPQVLVMNAYQQFNSLIQ